MSSNPGGSGPFPHADRVFGKSTSQAKFDCPGCGRVLEADYRNPLFLEALERARAYSGATPRPVGGRCPVCDGPLAKRSRRPKDDIPDRAPDPPAPEARGPRKGRRESLIGIILGLPPFVWILAAVGAGSLFLLGIVCAAVVILVLPRMAGSGPAKHPAPWAQGISPPPASDVFARGPAVYLADMQEFGVRAGPWPFGKSGQVGDGKPIQLDGVPSPKGLSMHPPHAPGYAAARYRLGKRAAVLRAVVAINDTTNWCFSPAVFTVLGDGKVLWQSATIAHCEPHRRSQECSVNVSGVDGLEVHVHCINGDPGVHAVWVQPRLLQHADTPDPEAPRPPAE